MAKGLGQVLLEQGVIAEDQLAAAEEHSSARGTSLGKSLVQLGYLSENDLVRALANQLGMPYAEVDGGAVDPTAAEMIPRSLAEEVEALPVQFAEGDVLIVAVADPGNTAAKEKIEAETGLTVQLALASRRAIATAITHMVPSGGSGRGSSGVATQTATRPLDIDVRTLESEEESSVDLNELLLQLVDLGGSDLHLTSGIPPSIRLHGELRPLQGYDPMTPVELRKMLYAILTQKQREKFENALELDTSYSIPGKARFRVNIFQQRDALGSVMRVIPFEIKPLDSLGVPAQVANFAYLPRGFVLITGPTGSGKSTTLAALIDLVNANRAAHIITV